jgi:hypothetical protein
MSTERKPLLSDDVMDQIGLNVCDDDGASVTGNAVRDYYENLITTGKLRVVEDVEHLAKDAGYKCSGCGWSALWEFRGLCDEVNYCPGCGNKIKNP